MSAAMGPSAHHYIPRFHLRQFGAETLRVPSVPGRFGRRPGHIWQHDKQSGLAKRVPIKVAAQRPGYYAVPTRAPVDLERALMLLETMVAPVIRGLHELGLGAHMIAPADRVAIASYVALLYVRTPAYRDPAASQFAFAKNVEVDMDLASPKRFIAKLKAAGHRRSDVEAEPLRRRMLGELREGAVRFEAPDQMSLLGMQAAIEMIMPALLMREWVIHRFAGPFRLVLGDAPVTIATQPSHDPTFGAGPATQGVAILTPLSPTALLVMLDGDPNGPLWITDDDADGPLEMPTAAEANRYAWRWSRQFVYGRSQADVEAAALLLDPVVRSLRPKMHVFNMPPEWVRYTGADVVASTDRRMPENLVRFSVLPGDVDANAGAHAKAGR